MSFEPILLAPEEVIEEVYPFRRVWRTSWIEAILLASAVAVIWAAGGLLELIPNTPAVLPRLGIATLPVLAWLVLSYGGERRARQPRPHMLGMLILGGLAANAIAVPLEERVFEPDLWLTTIGFFGRALGFTFTVGLTTAFLLYLVLRYSVWPEHFQQRQDGVAYALAAALGYATVYNLRAALYTDITLVATALRVASITYAHLAVGALIGFFLAELIIGRVPIFWMPFGIGFGALIGGLYHAFRAVAIVGGLSVESTGSSPVRGLALAFGLVAVVYIAVAFVIENADLRQRHATGRQELL